MQTAYEKTRTALLRRDLIRYLNRFSGEDDTKKQDKTLEHL